MLMFGADRIFRAQGQEAVNDKDIELVCIAPAGQQNRALRPDGACVRAHMRRS